MSEAEKEFVEIAYEKNNNVCMDFNIMENERKKKKKISNSRKL